MRRRGERGVHGERGVWREAEPLGRRRGPLWVEKGVERWKEEMK